MGTTCHCLLSLKEVLVRIVQAQDALWIWTTRALQNLRLLVRKGKAWPVKARVKLLGLHSIVAMEHTVHLIPAGLLRILRFLRTLVHALTAMLTMIRLVPSLVPPLITKLPSAPPLTPGKIIFHCCQFSQRLEVVLAIETLKKACQHDRFVLIYCLILPLLPHKEMFEKRCQFLSLYLDVNMDLGNPKIGQYQGHVTCHMWPRVSAPPAWEFYPCEMMLSHILPTFAAKCFGQSWKFIDNLIIYR
jgi:hypothetical protein